MPLISVIVPVYNSEKFINNCIDSILNQSFSDFELLLVDDGSPDNCGKICDEYAENDDRITVIHQKNAGQAVARNNAIKIAKGEWLLFVDSDDLIHPQTVEILYNSAVSNNVDISMCRYLLDSNPDNFSLNFFEKDYKETLFTANDTGLASLINNQPSYYWLVCTKLIKKSIVEKFLFTPGRFYEDNAVAFKWLIEAKNAVGIDAQLYFYRDNAGSTVHQKHLKNHVDYLWAISQQIDYYDMLKYCIMLGCTCNMFLNKSIEILRSYSGNPEINQVLATSLSIIKKYGKTCMLSPSYIESVLIYSGKSAGFAKLYSITYRISKLPTRFFNKLKRKVNGPII